MLSGIRPLLLWCKGGDTRKIMQEIRRDLGFFCMRVFAHSSSLWK
jgi:hypothetical protein